MLEKTIGEKIKLERQHLGLSLDAVASTTKIRKEYLIAIENNDFNKFASHVYAKGFIKNYANFLKLNEKPLLALYRRDYENTFMKRKIEKPVEEESKTFKNNELNKRNNKIKNKLNIQLSPRKVGFSIFIIIIIILILIIIKFINNAFAPPYLKITYPVELTANASQNLDYYDNQISFKGETSSYTLIKINDIPITLKSGFQFESSSYPVTSDKNVFTISATSQLGITSSIKLELNKKIANQPKSDSMNAVISVLNEDSIVDINADGVKQFDGVIHQGDEFPINAKSKLEIKTSKPSNIKLVINDTEYKLTKIDQEFDFVNGKVTSK